MLYRCQRFMSGQAEKVAFLELVKTLRYKTEAPLSDCSSALKESGNDIEQAIKVLQRKGAARAVKKGARITEHGFVMRCVWNGNNVKHNSVGAMVSVCSETDFAARSEPFQRACIAIQEALMTLITESHGTLFDNSCHNNYEGEEKREIEVNVNASNTANISDNSVINNEAVLELLRQRTQKIVQGAIAVLGENVRLGSVIPLRSSLTLPAHIDESNSYMTIGSYVHGGIDHLQSASGVKTSNNESNNSNNNNNDDSNNSNSNNSNSKSNTKYSKEIGRIVGLVGLAPKCKHHKEAAIETKACINEVNSVCNNTVIDAKLADSVARHFVATCGSEKDWRQEVFFGAGDENETISHWLKRHGLQFTGSLVIEFGKDPIMHLPERNMLLQII